MVYKFQPVDDIDAYVWALKREGFYSDTEIDEIRVKHENARKELDEKVEKFQRERRIKIMNKTLKNFCNQDYDSTKVILKFKVVNNKVKTKIVVPFAELEDWVKVWDTKKPPIKTILKCLKLYGESREFLERLVLIHSY